MAFMVPCPRCGPRPVEEFTHGEIALVPDSLTDPDSRDVDRVFMRDNPTGPTREGWFHSSGCRRWAYLERDRASNRWT